MKVGDAVEVFLDAKLADGIKETTIRWYRRRLGQLAEHLAGRQVQDVTRMDVRQFMVWLRKPRMLYENHPCRDPEEGTLSPSTRQGYTRAVKTFFNWLDREGCLDENPAKYVKLPKVPAQKPKAIQQETLAALLEETEGDEPVDKRNRALLLFLADTGCRVGGIVGLRVEDLRLGEGMATVTEKGDKWRPVMFTEATQKALRDWLTTREVDSAWVFCSMNTGEQLVPTSVNHIIYRLRDAGEIEGRCNPHSFRHAFAREYLMNGGDLATLATLMGHSDVKVTEQFYSRFRFRELQAKHRRYSPVANLDLDGGET